MVVEVLAGMILMFLSRWRRLPGEETHIWLLPPNMAVILSQAATFGEQQQKLQVSIQFNNLTKSEGMFLESSGYHCLHQVLQITIIVWTSFCPQTTPGQSEYEQTRLLILFLLSLMSTQKLDAHVSICLKRDGNANVVFTVAFLQSSLIFLQHSL